MVGSISEPSRPPDQYLPASGTLACLLPNEYDRNIYSECAYIGNRTLIKCRQVRRKEQLALNGGQCELHTKLANNLKRRYTKEKARLSLEGTKKKYRKVIQSEELVSDEDEFLLPCSHWTVPKQDSVYFFSHEDDLDIPLMQAGVYTDKEVLQVRMALLNKEIKHLEHYREMTAENIRRTAEFTLEPTKSKRKRASLDSNQLKDYLAKRTYHKETVVTKRLKAMKSRVPEDSVYCLFGDSEDSVAVEDVVGKLVSSVANDDFIPIPAQGSSRCVRLALPGAKHCLIHVTKGGRIPSFPKCDSCNNVVIFTNDTTKNLCPIHCYRASHRYPLSISIGNFSNRGSQPASDMSNSPFFYDYESDDDLTNEMRQNFDISSIRAARSRIRHSPYGAKPGGTLMSPTQLNMTMQARLREADTCRAARCRPFNRENFPEKTHRSAVSRTPTMCLTRAVRPSITFNPVPRLQIKPRGFDTLKRPNVAQPSHMRPLFNTQSTSRPQPSPRPYVPTHNMNAYNPRPQIPREASLLQRKQIEEDQKAAASILDDKIEEELVEDREPSPISQPSALPPPTQRFVTGSRIPPPPARMPVRTTYSTISGVVPPSRTVYRGMAVNDPKRMATYSSFNSSQINRRAMVMRGGMPRCYDLNTSGRPSVPQQPLDLSHLPSNVQDKPLGEVLRMQYQEEADKSPRKSVAEMESGFPPASTSSTSLPPTVSKLPAPTATNHGRPTALLPIKIIQDGPRLPPHRLIKQNARPAAPNPQSREPNNK
ncbi:unnamed protein product [Auanema sp. JU1783]|nr:unnamed protein product [Auanema sp. JU1783]